MPGWFARGCTVLDMNISSWHSLCSVVQAFNLVRRAAGKIPQCPSGASRAEKVAKAVQDWCLHAPDVLR